MRKFEIKEEDQRGFRIEAPNITENKSKHSHKTESDISQQEVREHRGQSKLSQILYQPTRYLMKEINMKSERRDHDCYIYEIKTQIKLIEVPYVVARTQLTKRQVKVQNTPLRLPGKVLYFQVQSKFF